jgi:hypothetical protein
MTITAVHRCIRRKSDGLSCETKADAQSFRDIDFLRRIRPDNAFNGEFIARRTLFLG